MPLILWVSLLIFSLFVLVLVGGATRITDSGLSITEWEPFIGFVPPLTSETWLLEFEKYKKIPEYTLVNFEMNISEFKTIYLWEWGHRFLARLVGLIAFLPFLYFAITKRLTKSQKIKSVIIIILIGIQGYIGWYMVKSGLVERIDVSQYRLAVHLTMAFVIIYTSLLLMFDILKIKTSKITYNTTVWANIFLFIIFLQIFIGGIVSGLDAGLIYPTWPRMGEYFIPLDYWSYELSVYNFFENRSNVQFNHRSIGYLIFIMSSINLIIFRNKPSLFKLSIVIFILVLIQIFFGILSVLFSMPWQTALTHQFFALILFSSSCLLSHLLRFSK